MYKIGLSSKSNAFTAELFSECREHGVSVMELSRCSAGYDCFDYATAAELARSCGVEFRSLHLPFRPYDIFDISDERCVERAIEANKRIIDEGVKVGIKIFVIHPSGVGISAAERPQRLACVKYALASLVEHAKPLGARIAVENMAHDCLGNSIAEFEQLVGAHPDLCICFDVNHLLFESHEDFIRLFGKKIITTHISDSDLVDERHWMPGRGAIDFTKILTALAEVGYDGPWLYEVSYTVPNTSGGPSVSDFVENANALFATVKS